MMHRSKARSVWLLLAAVGCPWVAHGATVGSVSLIPNQDSTIFFESNNAFGGGDVMLVGNNNATGPTGNPRRALLEFDLTGALPAGAVVTDVALTLHLDGSGPTAGNRTLALHRLTSSWDSGSSGTGGAGGGGGQGVAPAPGDVTWNFRSYNDQAWSTAGGDFVAASSATLSVGTNVGYYTWATTAALVADVNGWLADPASNFGWILLGEEAAKGAVRRFDSVERSEPSYRPVLRIGYTVVPEPAGYQLLAAAALALTVVRRLRR